MYHFRICEYKLSNQNTFYSFTMINSYKRLFNNLFIIQLKRCNSMSASREISRATSTTLYYSLEVFCLHIASSNRSFRLAANASKWIITSIKKKINNNKQENGHIRTSYVYLAPSSTWFQNATNHGWGAIDSIINIVQTRSVSGCQAVSDT